MENRDFFISYAHEDEKYAELIAKTLVDNGYSVHFQKWDSASQPSFVTWINNALDHSDSFIAIWSNKYKKSGFCQSEIETAYTLFCVDEMQRIIPVRFEDCKLPPIYRPYSRVDFFDLNKETWSQKLLEVIQNPSTTEATEVTKVTEVNQNHLRPCCIFLSINISSFPLC